MSGLFFFKGVGKHKIMKSHFEIYLILSIVKMLFLLSTFN